MQKPHEDRGLPIPGNPPGEVPVVVTAGVGRTAVRLELRAQGRDFLLLAGGGEVHVGAVAVASDGSQELVVVPGHKEGPLAARCAREVALASGRTCVAVAGIHQDQATREEIDAIVAHVGQALDKLLSLAFSVGKKGMEIDGQP